MSCIRIAGNGAKKNIPRNYHGIFDITGGWGGIVIPTHYIRGPLSLRTLCVLVPNPATCVAVSNPMPIVIKIKHPCGCLIFMADGEGFEPPDELPRQRFSRPSHSTALPPILNFVCLPILYLFFAKRKYIFWF